MAITANDDGLDVENRQEAKLEIDNNQSKSFDYTNPTATGNSAQAHINLVEQGNRQSADALTRQMNNNTAMTNAQIAQAGLGEQGAGAAMAQQTAQQNAQLAQQAQQDALQNSAQAQIEAGRLRVEEQNRLNAQRDADKKEWDTLVANGQYDEADKLSQEKGLGLSTGNKRWEQKEKFIQSEITRLSTEIANGEGKMNMNDYEKLKAELSFFNDLQTKINDARANGTDFFEVVNMNMNWDSNSFTNSRQWTQAESDTFWYISNSIAALALDDKVDQTAILNQYLGSKNYDSIDTFFTKASVEDMQELGYLLGLMLYGRDAKGELSPYAKEQMSALGAGGLSVGADYLSKSGESVKIKEEQEKADLEEKPNPELGYTLNVGRNDVWVSSKLFEYVKNEMTNIGEDFVSLQSDKQFQWEDEFKGVMEKWNNIVGELRKSSEGKAIINYLGLDGIYINYSSWRSDGKRSSQNIAAKNKLDGYISKLNKLYLNDGVPKPQQQNTTSNINVSDIIERETQQ
jgi:hypothetical protein